MKVYFGTTNTNDNLKIIMEADLQDIKSIRQMNTREARSYLKRKKDLFLEKTNNFFTGLIASSNRRTPKGFIEVTESDGEKVLINIALIKVISGGTETKIKISSIKEYDDRNTYYVIEPYRTVLRLIEEAS